jgi:alkanesulfonate monooxygenase SsuD/methylene tetrahydromethanopterin reductase-like flavin-dependent oxidoreductase (luciferase family)
MKFAIYVPNFDTFGDVQTVVDLAKSAEATGWDGFFLWDHLLPDNDSKDGPVADTWLTLATIASVTQRIRLGALVTAFPRRRPWKVARESVTLDHLSKGRLVVGAGIGGDWWREYSAVGESGDMRRHGEMLDEGLEVMTQLWTGNSVSYSGAHYTLNEAKFLPTPYQSPRIPIWVAGVWPGTRPFRRAARWDGVFPIGRFGDLTPQNIGEMAAYIEKHRTVSSDTGTGGFDVVYNGRMYEKDAAEATTLLQQYANAGLTWWLESFWPDAPLENVTSVIEQGPPQI